MKLIKRSVPLWALILALVACGSVVAAALIFETGILTHTVSLKAVGEIEIWYASEFGTTSPTEWLLLPSAGALVNWGEFEIGGVEALYYKIKNVGNVEAYVLWKKTNFGEEEGKWDLKVFISSAEIPEGQTYLTPIPPGGEITGNRIRLEEIAAEPNVEHSFGVLWEAHDAPVP